MDITYSQHQKNHPIIQKDGNFQGGLQKNYRGLISIILKHYSSISTDQDPNLPSWSLLDSESQWTAARGFGWRLWLASKSLQHGLVRRGPWLLSVLDLRPGQVELGPGDVWRTPGCLLAAAPRSSSCGPAVSGWPRMAADRAIDFDHLSSCPSAY